MENQAFHQRQHNIEEQEAEQSSMLLQNIGDKFLRLWPWLLASVIIGGATAYLFLKASSPAYKIHASVLVQDDKKSTELGQASILQDFDLFGKSNVDNEAEILKSRTLMAQVVENLDLSVSYHIEGSLKNTELYAEKPVDLSFFPNTEDSATYPLELVWQQDTKHPNAFTLSYNERSFNGQLNDTLRLPEGKVLLTATKNMSAWKAATPLKITVVHPDAATQKYLSSLKVEIPNKQVSVIYLTLSEVIQAKGEAILNALVNSYMQANVTDKNRIADSTMQFIDERLALVFGELSDIEKSIEQFKTKNQLVDISTQSGILLNNSSEYARQQTTNEVQLSIVKSLEEFLKANINDERIVPSSLVMQEAGFIALVQRYNDALLQREKMLMSMTKEHPGIVTINQQLVNLRQELLSSINSVKRGIQVSVHELAARNSGFTSEIRKLPSRERNFLDYSRQQAIKQELYLFLLKKREETAISKSATIASARIIDRAKSDPGPYKPQRAMVLVIGLLAGLFIPFGISFGKDFLNTKVTAIPDITKATNCPILSEIGHNTENTTVALQHRHLVSEQFRSLRTNLQYLLPGKEEKTILVTSSMSGEGKSFLSINLSATLALAGKKVILLEFDLRKPKVTQNLQLQQSGFTNYILDKENNWEKWIQPSGVCDSFHVLSSGPLPPNPTELLMLPKMNELIAGLKAQYDYIIIDTPPAGMVTDAEIMATYADITLYLVRHHFTFKQQIRLIEKLAHKKTLPRINIVVNDVDLKKGNYGYNTYGYGNYYA
ncbi:MAG: GumC family protein [Chitinophagaceae bacterium]